MFTNILIRCLKNTNLGVNSDKIQTPPHRPTKNELYRTRAAWNKKKTKKKLNTKF